MTLPPAVGALPFLISQVATSDFHSVLFVPSSSLAGMDVQTELSSMWIPCQLMHKTRTSLSQKALKWSSHVSVNKQAQVTFCSSQSICERKENQVKLCSLLLSQFFPCRLKDFPPGYRKLGNIASHGGTLWLWNAGDNQACGGGDAAWPTPDPQCLLTHNWWSQPQQREDHPGRDCWRHFLTGSKLALALTVASTQLSPGPVRISGKLLF